MDQNPGRPARSPGVTTAPTVGSATPAAQTAATPLRAVERFLWEGLPVAAVAHSYHVEALRDPRVMRDPAFQAFSMIELNELHHQVAAMGSLFRLQRGDPTAAESLAYNLAGFLQNRQAALQVVPRISPAAIRNRAAQQMMSLMQLSNQQVAQFRPALNQAMTLGAAAPGPLLVRPPM